MKNWKAIAEKQAEYIQYLQSKISGYNSGYRSEKMIDFECELSQLESQEVEEVNNETALYAFRKFFNERYEKHHGENWKIEILNVDVRDFINSKEYAQQSSKVTDDDIEKYIEKKYPVIMHEGEDINGYFKECLTEDLKALRDGVIKKSN